MSYIVLRNGWCNIIVLKVHAPGKETNDDLKNSYYEELGRYLIIFLSTIRKFFSRFYCKSGMRNIFKLTTGNEILHQDSNDKGMRIINFAT